MIPRLSRKKPTGLLARAAMTIAAALLLYDIFSHLVIGYYILFPVAKQSADDLAALMVLSAQRWEELSTIGRATFETELSEKGLRLVRADKPLPESTDYTPYLSYLKDALAERTGSAPVIRTNWNGEKWFWVDIPLARQSVRIGFSSKRLPMDIPDAVLFLMLAGAALTLGTALIFVRRLALPIDRLSQAAMRLGRGETPDPIPETGPQELAALAKTFNRMALQVKELLANRTTLLAGISHDLRTPLARMQLAVELLSGKADAELLEGMRRDLDGMNELIGEFLELSRGLEKEDKQPTDISRLLRELVDDAQRGGADVDCETADPCVLHIRPVALRRVLCNLVENAVRYSDGRHVSVRHEYADGNVFIKVLDRGPGIPPDQREAVFRPFHRLEQSRSSATGGSGLGLAIARQLADANGWRIEFLSRQGGGTEARVTV